MYETFKALLTAYGVLIQSMVITKFLIFTRRKSPTRCTVRAGYKIVATLEFRMTRDGHHAALREIGLRPLEYKTKHLPPGVFKVQVLNAHKYDNA